MFIILLCVAWQEQCRLFFGTSRTFLLSLQRRLLEVSYFTWVSSSSVAKQTGNLIGNSVGKWKERNLFWKKVARVATCIQMRTYTQQLLFGRNGTARKAILAFRRMKSILKVVLAKREFICSVENIFHRKKVSSNFCGKYFPPFFSFPHIHLLSRSQFSRKYQIEC